MSVLQKSSVLLAIFVPKNFHSWWKFDKVMTKIILHSCLRHGVYSVLKNFLLKFLLRIPIFTLSDYEQIFKVK